MSNNAEASMSLFMLLANNCDIEIGMIQGSTDGMTFDIVNVFTNGHKSQIDFSDNLEHFLDREEIVLSVIHSHPQNTIPSGFNEQSTKGDKTAMNNLNRKYKIEPLWFVYLPAREEFWRYDNAKNSFAVYEWIDAMFKRKENLK